MSATTTVNVYDLWKIAHQLKADKMFFVEVSILSDGSMSFSAMKKLDDDESVVYDSIDPATPGQ